MLEEIATNKNFDENLYLLANPDVAIAVRNGTLKSGLSHFQAFGKNENRMIHFSSSAITEAKQT